MPIRARNSLSGDQASGTNSGSITLAMNSTVISGTPRTNSMKITENNFTAGIVERRPSASRIPIGSENTMPAHETTMVTSTPPQSEVSTLRKPINGMPVSSAKDTSGTTTKKYRAPISRRGASSHSIQTMPTASSTKKTSTRQRSGIGYEP